MTEKALPKIDGIQEILRERTHVIAETFLLIDPGSYGENTQIVMHEFLSLHGITYHDPITFWKSEKDRIQGMIEALKEKKARRPNDPWMYIVGVNPDQLQEMFEAIPKMIIEKDPILEGIKGKNITILRLNAPETSRRIDEKTGVTFVTLKKGEPAYPLHLTPAD